MPDEGRACRAERRPPSVVWSLTELTSMRPISSRPNSVANRSPRRRVVGLVVVGSSAALLAVACNDGPTAGRDKAEAPVAIAASAQVAPDVRSVLADGAAPQTLQKRAEPSLSGKPFAASAPAVPPTPSPASPAQATAISQSLSSMIIRTGYAGVEVDSLDIAITRVRALAQRVGGFVANTAVQGGKDQLRSASLEVKVPSERFDEALSGLAPIGKVESVNVTAQDVGEEYVDIAARVENSHRLEARLVNLLANRTGKLQDVLTVERELARVREEIERYEGRMRYLRARVSLSTLTIAVHERAPIIVPIAGDGPITVAFREAWRNFVGFVAAGIASLGVLVPLGVLVFVAFLGLRRLGPWRHHPAPSPPSAGAVSGD